MTRNPKRSGSGMTGIEDVGIPHDDRRLASGGPGEVLT